MSKFDEDKLIWNSFQLNRETLYTAINVLQKQGNLTLETSNYLLGYLADMDVHFRKAYDMAEDLTNNEQCEDKDVAED